MTNSSEQRESRGKPPLIQRDITPRAAAELCQLEHGAGWERAALRTMCQQTPRPRHSSLLASDFGLFLNAGDEAGESGDLQPSSTVLAESFLS